MDEKERRSDAPLNSSDADSHLDHKWMARALALARRGEALAHPNPMVGAVVVSGGQDVGEGFHTYDGRNHAEVLALETAGEKARGATLYVSLEPCCHTGRTGPCTDTIIAAGVKRVVAAMTDPNPRVAGKGFAKLRKAGVEVRSGVLEADARRLNEAFACWIRAGRPLVTLKAGVTLDGRVASTEGSATWITSPASRLEVQRMRHASDALLTGIGTVLTDDPRLTDRTGLPRRRPLLRVVLDSRLRIPQKSHLVRQAAGDVLVFTHQSEKSRMARALARAGVRVLRAPGRGKELSVRDIVGKLGELELLSVMIEAGPRLNAAALHAGVVDKAVLFYAPKLLGGDAVPLVAGGFPSLATAPELKEISLRRFGEDFALEGYFHDVYGDH